jgi:hypothetical protein
LGTKSRRESTRSPLRNFLETEMNSMALALMMIALFFVVRHASCVVRVASCVVRHASCVLRHALCVKVFC